MHAVICDLDGLLVDSEGIHFEAYKTVLADFGIDLTREMFISGWLGGKHYGTHYYLQKAGVLDDSKIDEVRAQKAELYCSLGKGRLHSMPGAEAFLKRVQEEGIACGVGTGGYSREYEFSIQECGLAPYIQTVVGGNDVEKNKPAPDIFLKVAENLGVDPQNAVVFENSDIGMNAALNADMKCIVIPSDFTKEQDFSAVNQVLSSLDDVKLKELFAL